MSYSKSNYHNNKSNHNREEIKIVLPLHNSTQEKLKSNACNFSLYFPRMVSWVYKGNELKANENIMQKLCDKSKSSFDHVSNFLTRKHSQQSSFLIAMKEQGLKTFELTAKLTSPFITGLGSGHPTETGMILDRNIGVPYIPASSIKGVLRLACAINIAKTNGVNFVNENDELLKQYFGSVTQNEKQQKRGELVFLDAYPLGVPDLKLDIMNPHFGKYYKGENKSKQPVETERPVPIKFLSVATGTIFVFRCVYLPLDEKTCDENFIQQIFTTAFEQVGFGGKTSIGYGRFFEVSEDEIKHTTIDSNNTKTEPNLLYPRLKKGKQYQAKLKEKNKSGKLWIAMVDGYEDIKCTITQGNIPNDKNHGDVITIELITEPANGNCNCKYIGAL